MNTVVIMLVIKSICYGYGICIKVTWDIKLYFTRPTDVDTHILHVVLYLMFTLPWILVLRRK